MGASRLMVKREKETSESPRGGLKTRIWMASEYKDRPSIGSIWRTSVSREGMVNLYAIGV